MYLSRVALNSERRETMKALSSPHLIHGAVEQGFHGTRLRNLWRIDWLNNTCNLLVLSEVKPDFSNIVKQFGYPELNNQWEMRNYKSFLTKLQTGQTWQFRLVANPVRSSNRDSDTKTGRGKVFAHVTKEQQKQWLLDRSNKLGFKITKNSFDVTHSRWMKFRKGSGKNMVSLRTVTFEGLLEIVDVELFNHVLLNGIGRAKAYGCGLMTIITSQADQHVK